MHGVTGVADYLQRGAGKVIAKPGQPHAHWAAPTIDQTRIKLTAANGNGRLHGSSTPDHPMSVVGSDLPPITLDLWPTEPQAAVSARA